MSENELEVSKIKLDKYILCLVDYTRITEPGYSPDYETLAWDYQTTSVYESNYGGPPYRMHPTE